MCGNPKDYDEWADAGNRGWSYEKVLSYFLKLENNKDSKIINLIKVRVINYERLKYRKCTLIFLLPPLLIITIIFINLIIIRMSSIHFYARLFHLYFMRFLIYLYALSNKLSTL